MPQANDDDDDDREDFPNRLLFSEVFALDEEQDFGVLLIETDSVDARLAINQEAAKELRDALDLFLKRQAPPLPDPPTEH